LLSQREAGIRNRRRHAASPVLNSVADLEFCAFVFSSKKVVRVWVGACSHIHSDLKHGRRSLAEAIEQSEKGGPEGGDSFDWDIMLHLGDISGTQTPLPMPMALLP
jgi:hypothetical protein